MRSLIVQVSGSVILQTLLIFPGTSGTRHKFRVISLVLPLPNGWSWLVKERVHWWQVYALTLRVLLVVPLPNTFSPYHAFLPINVNYKLSSPSSYDDQLYQPPISFQHWWLVQFTSKVHALRRWQLTFRVTARINHHDSSRFIQHFSSMLPHFTLPPLSSIPLIHQQVEQAYA